MLKKTQIVLAAITLCLMAMIFIKIPFASNAWAAPPEQPQQATCLVTSTADGGPGSPRECLQNAGSERNLFNGNDDIYTVFSGRDRQRQPDDDPLQSLSHTEVPTYTVKSGDSLSKIALEQYGNMAQWPTLYAANTELIGANPNLIAPGQIFQIPFLDKRTVYACNGRSMTEAELAGHREISLETLNKLRTNRGLTYKEICNFSDTKLKRAINKAENPKPDHPDEALAFRLLQLQDENGFIPSDGLAKAARQIEVMRANPPQGAGIAPMSWTWLGPGNIGGRVRSVLIHPTNPNLMWLGSVSGGIWKSGNGGASWQVEDDFMANMAVSTLAMDSANPDIMYAGTGEGFYNIDGIRGAGVFKTIDGGTTWGQLASTANSNWYYVNRLAVHPTNSQIILAATSTGIWRSTNAGSNWTQVHSTRTLDLDFDPTNGNKAIAAGSFGQAWYSTDGGQTWTQATGLPVLDWLGRVEVVYAPSNPNIVYASVNQNSGEIYKSADGGQSYTGPINPGTSFYLGNQGWYDNIVWVDPTNSNVVIVGGIDLWRSSNGGATLTKISQWFSAPTSAHADHHFILEHPSFDGSTNTTVFFANDGGLYKTDDVYTVVPLSGWQELNNNLGITQFYGAAGNPTTGVIVGGTQDNGTLRYTGGTETWDDMFGGDGGFSAADPTDPNYFYGEYVNLQIHRSANGGTTSSYIYSGIGDAGSNANFIAPFILDPNNPNTMLAGGGSLWRSTNVKAPTPTWVSIKGDIGSNISAIATAPGNSDIIWVGHNDGNVYKTTNGTAGTPIWTRVDIGTPNLPDRYVMRLTIDPNNHDIVYATFGGFSIDNVWRTVDGGTTWSDITGSGATGLPDVPVRSLVIHPNISNWLYVGTEVGIFTSDDGGGNWTVPHDGPTNTSVDELFWIGPDLVSATHGRGLFKATPATNSGYLTLTKSASPDPAAAGNALTYTIVVANSVQTSTGVIITDPVPVNTTYVPGSASNGGSESGGVVSFPPITLLNGEVITRTFQVNVSAALVSTQFFFDDIESGAGLWTVVGTPAWTPGTTNPHSPVSSWFADDISSVSDQRLEMVSPVTINGDTVLRFWHDYNMESNYDGGVVEISVNGGAWTDLGPLMMSNGYNDAISTCCDNPLGGRDAFSGDSGGYVETLVDLSSYSGDDIQIRFRMGTDYSVAADGWYIDDVEITNEASISNTACVEATEGASSCDTLNTPVEALPSFDCASQSQIPVSECEALLTLYTSTGGPNWNDNTDWMTTNTPCNWYGVSCDAGHITQINLQANQLVGAIPPELGDLTNLTMLRLENNVLDGEIPTTIVNLVNLSDTDLSYNKLTATDPTVITFLNSKDPDWADTQTVAPTDVYVSGGSVDETMASIRLGWMPIPYTEDGGYYEISYATTSGGPYTVHGITADKTASSYLVDNLPVNATYYFVIKTFTPAHGNQQNDLWSEFSPEVFETVYGVGSATITPEGGELLATIGQSDITLTFPVGAVSEPVRVSLRAEITPPAAPAGLSFLDRAFTIEARTPTGTLVTNFSQPFTMTIAYNEAGLAEAGPKLHHWNERTDRWEEVSNTVDLETRLVTTQLDYPATLTLLVESKIENQIYLPILLRDSAR